MATDEQIGQLCANVVNRFAGPNVNARTMLQMPEFWVGLVGALRGEEEIAATAEPQAVEGRASRKAKAELPSETPTLISLEPNNVELGNGVSMTLIGTGFTADSVIVFDGNEIATGMASSAELNTIVKASFAEEAGIVNVSVKTGEHKTSPLSFTFTETGEEDEEEEGKSRRVRRTRK